MVPSDAPCSCTSRVRVTGTQTGCAGLLLTEPFEEEPPLETLPEVPAEPLEPEPLAPELSEEFEELLSEEFEELLSEEPFSEPLLSEDLFSETRGTSTVFSAVCSLSFTEKLSGAMALSAPRYWPAKSTSEPSAVSATAAFCAEKTPSFTLAPERSTSAIARPVLETDLPSRVSASTSATRVPLPLTTTRRMFLMVLLS